MVRTNRSSTSSAMLGTSRVTKTVSRSRWFAAASSTAQAQQYSNTTEEVYEKGAEKSADSSITKEEIERLLQQHQVRGVSMPVRTEFVREKPLNTDDLEAIDIRVYHRKPETISDHVAYRSVKMLRFFADAFFRKRYVHRVIVLETETVAGVPGMVAGMLCPMSYGVRPFSFLMVFLVTTRPIWFKIMSRGREPRALKAITFPAFH